MTKTIAYLRVSTDEQDLKKNKADILHLANEKSLGKVQWVEETVSGQVSWRKRKIAQVLESLQAGHAETSGRLNLMDKQLANLTRDVRDLRGALTRQLLAQDAKLDAQDAKLEAQDAKLDALNAKLDAQDAKLDAILARLPQS